MEFYQIRYFLALAKYNNFTKAAEACNVSQPALTRAVQRLEHCMGGTLFQRQSRETTLTALGRSVLPFLQSMIEYGEMARREAMKQSAARNLSLSIGLAATLGPNCCAIKIANTLHRLASNVPSVEVNILRGTGQQVIDWLVSGVIEIGITAQPDYPEQIKANALFEEGFAIAFAPGHDFEKLREVPFSALTNQIILERLNCEYLEIFRDKFKSFPQQPTVRCHSEDENLIQEMVAAGAGCAILPRSLLMRPGIMMRPISQPMTNRTISTIVMRGQQHSEILRKFLCLFNAGAKLKLEQRVELDLMPLETA